MRVIFQSIWIVAFYIIISWAPNLPCRDSSGSSCQQTVIKVKPSTV